MTGATSPSLSIVVRCRDEREHIGGVLEAVLAQDGAAPFEVVALDSGSRDGTLEILGRYPVRVEHDHRAPFSYGRALNRGADLARGEIVVYLSAHCRPLTRQWLATLTAPFSAREVLATFGRQVPVPRVNPIEAITTGRNFPPSPPAGVRFSTANGAVRRSAVRARPFDEEAPIAEDHLWACGLRAAEIVYVPAAGVGHSHPMTLAHWRARFYAHGLATQYARARLGFSLPWDDATDSGAGVARRRALPFLRLLGELARRGEFRALARIPSYALARTIWYAKGVQDGMERYVARRSR
jgi:glycosyltransferase involved in cell wall biosynthesis